LKKFVETDSHTTSFMHAISFAIRGCEDEDGCVGGALETASHHADSYVGRQWAHRNMMSSRSRTLPRSMHESADAFSNSHAKTARLFSGPVTLSELWHDAADIFGDDQDETLQNRRTWVERVIPVHLLITANTLRRPILVFEPPPPAVTADSDDADSDSTGRLECRSLQGLYLPISCSPDTCIRDPILLLHKPDGFDLAGTKSGGKAPHGNYLDALQSCLAVSPPKHKALDQWFAPILPQVELRKSHLVTEFTISNDYRADF